MDLRFPLLDGGQEQGLNDAGVEAFQGSIGQYVVRECAQNSGDAPNKPGSKVQVVFDLLRWKIDDIPCVEKIEVALRASREYWKHDEKTRRFFERSLAELKASTITVLRVGDYGTTGLLGNDTDRTKGWYALVKSQGVSVKDDTAGGSYGIGKSSPFAASRFRTVFYSTRTTSGDVAFQGVCRLVTHKNSSGNTTQSVGFIGDYLAGHGGSDPVFTAIRAAEKVPVQFQRDETGTDIFIPGYFTNEDNWERELVVSILNSFWPAIHRGSMEFVVAGNEITKANIGELVTRFREVPEFTAHLYYGSLADPKRREHAKNLHSVGKCKLSLTTEGEDLPKNVCLIRRAGMIIDVYGPHNIRTPYAGLFVCEDTDGNRLLRAMEPPRHDRWDPKRVEGIKGRQAISEIREWIREKVRELNPAFTGDSFNEDDLGKYLPELEDGQTAGAEGTNENEGEGGLFGVPREKQPEPIAIPIDKPIGPGPGEGPGQTGKPDPKGGDDKNTGGRVRRRGGGGNRPRLEMRSYATAGSTDEYLMVLRCSEDFSGAIRVIAAGDDESDADIDLAACKVDGVDQPLPVLGNRISEVSVRASEPLRLRLKLTRPRRIALMIE